MKKYLLTTALCVCIALLSAGVGQNDQNQAHPAFNQAVIQKVLDHSVAIVGYYEVPRDQADILIKKMRAAGISTHQVKPSAPFQVPVSQDKVVVAVIGAGTIVKNGYIISVAHLVQVKDDTGAPLRLLKVWAIQRGMDHPVELDVVASTDLISKNTPFYNDYAVLRLKEDLGLPGITFGPHSPTLGQMVLCAGTVSGAAFFIRFAYAVQFQNFFRRGEDGAMHLSRWADFPFVCVYPGGGGDSGGGIFDQDGNLVGMMYCGLELATETYIFSNPLQFLKSFLASKNLMALYQ